MKKNFVYQGTSPQAVAYINWLTTSQKYRNRRRRKFALTAAGIFLGGILFVAIVAISNISPLYMLVVLITTITAAVLMTDTCRGYPFFDPVGAVIFNFNSMNEREIGQLEKKSMENGDGQEIQALLYCLRITANLEKYKKGEVILSRWQAAIEQGEEFFNTTPRGKLTFDFLTQIYFFHFRRVLTDYAMLQRASISNLKTESAKQRRLEKCQEILTKMRLENTNFPQIDKLINYTYKTIDPAANFETETQQVSYKFTKTNSPAYSMSITIDNGK